MKELELLKSELLLMLDNIERVKLYQEDETNKSWKPYNSNVVGELKHRAVALKQRLTLIKNLTTTQLFK